MNCTNTIYHSAMIIMLSAVLIAGSQILTLITRNTSYRAHGYWRKGSTPRLPLYVMILPETAALVSDQEDEYALDSGGSLLDYINEHRSRDIMLAAAGLVLTYWIVAYLR